MTTTTLATALAYYARHHAALFPIPKGQKAPTGIVSSWKHDYSTDPAQWSAWAAAHPGCNFGVVASASRWIIVDVDIGELGRDRAWSLYAEWCISNKLPVFAPYCQSARGGWHIAFQIPSDVDTASLAQRALIGRTDGSKKAVVDTRIEGFAVAAGSYYDGTAKGESSGPYVLMSDAAPHVAPAALLTHCARATTTRTNTAAAGSYDAGSVAALVNYMTQAGEFTEYDAWVNCGMALRIECGDAGFDIWESTFDAGVTSELAASKWESFASEPTPGCFTIQSLMKRAHALNWQGTLTKSTAAMFGQVAALAHSAGATLASAATLPLLDTQRTVAALGQPVLDNFLAGTKDAPLAPMAQDFPALPATLATHPLFELLSSVLQRIAAMAETGKQFRQERCLKALAVLSAVHEPTFQLFHQRITALGAVLSPASLDSAVKNFEWLVRTEVKTERGFIVDAKGMPASDNSDNVAVFTRERAIRLRYNVWNDRPEIADASQDNWQRLNDHLFGDLLMDAKNSHFNYHPSKELFRTGLISTARRNLYDPVRERVDALADAWDGKPRLISWLSHAAGVPCDPYHQAVGRNLIGGMVRRARHPGCVHSEVVLFITPKQGTGKSTLTKILALESDWHTDSFKFDGSPQNTIPQLFGKWVIELSELAGMAHRDMEHVKSFLSAQSDTFTPKYEAFARDNLRRCIFVGTSNDRRPLQDVSGNRRFLPVHVVGEVDTTWLQANIGQLIGEAAVREARGETFTIPREVWDEAGRHQEQARNMGPIEELCQEWFDRPAGSFYIIATDIGRALKMAGHNGRYTAFLDRYGWRRESLVVPGDGRKCRVWVRHENNHLSQCARLEPVQALPNSRVEMRMRQTP